MSLRAASPRNDVCCLGCRKASMSLMSQRLVRLSLLVVAAALAVSCLNSTPAIALRPGQLPPCPPRERGAPKPDTCYDPCPSDMVGEQPNCSCPPGTVKLGRPQKPGQHCSTPSSAPVMIEKSNKLKHVLKPCPDGRTGTDCHCPPGTMEPDCKPPVLIPQQVPKRQY